MPEGWLDFASFQLLKPHFLLIVLVLRGWEESSIFVIECKMMVFDISPTGMMLLQYQQMTLAAFSAGSPFEKKYLGALQWFSSQNIF